ncbi:MAG: hypothetical protein ACRD2L_05325 [Terriglobia bacterium]
MQGEWADFYWLPRRPKGLPERIQTAIELYPCDILFIHRDAESETQELRAFEINSALREVEPRVAIPPAVCVVPVRMQEAWLLFDEGAIRKAAGNPNGRDEIELPALTRIEQLPDPKQKLYELLRAASGLSGRRLSRLRPSVYAPRVSEFVESFAPLRVLPAFQALELEVRQTTNQLNTTANQLKHR